MINKVTLIGYLGVDPELKALENGTAVCRLSLATSDSYKDKAGEWQTQTEWHNLIFWREAAERAEKTLKKGMLIFVEGKLSYRKYKDNEGNEKSITDIIVNNFRRLEKVEKDNDAVFPEQYPKDEKKPNENPEPQAVGTEDLPF